MKIVATGLFVLAAVIYAVTLMTVGSSPDGWLGYLQAGAEAAMIGALADWFAVTALFRHPLGLPIPHTAIIPTRKDQMGATLGEFVGTHFLTDDVVREKVGAAEVTRRGGEWLADPDHATRVSGEMGRALRGLIAVLDDDQMRTMIERVIGERVERTEVSPALGHLLGQVVADGAHTGIVDVLADRMYAWVVTNRGSIIEVVTKQAPSWTPRFVDGVVGRPDPSRARPVPGGCARRPRPRRAAGDRPDARAVRRRPALEPRHTRAGRARQGRHVQPPRRPAFGQPDLGDRPARAARGRRRPRQRAAHRATGALVQLGQTLATDPDLQTRIDGWITDTVVGLVADYKVELTSVITDTVARWDGPQTATRIELAVGRDLQFIRINGTVVGCAGRPGDPRGHAARLRGGTNTRGPSGERRMNNPSVPTRRATAG